MFTRSYTIIAGAFLTLKKWGGPKSAIRISETKQKTFRQRQYQSLLVITILNLILLLTFMATDVNWGRGYVGSRTVRRRTVCRGTVRRGTVRRGTFRRRDSLPLGQFAVRTVRRTDCLPYGLFAVGTFRRGTVGRRDFSPYGQLAVNRHFHT